jgi:hypothetical protein
MPQIVQKKCYAKNVILKLLIKSFYFGTLLL